MWDMRNVDLIPVIVGARTCTNGYRNYGWKFKHISCKNLFYQEQLGFLEK